MKISVLTPTYNRINHLQELIYMFIKQDYIDKELIILNDNDYILYTCDVPSIKIYNHKLFKTLGEKRNYLLKLANGNLIHFWDDDDVRSYDCLSKLYDKYINRNTYTNGISFSKQLYFENYKACSDGYNFFFGLFSSEYYTKFIFDESLTIGEDQDFINRGLHYIDIINIDESPIGYCWDNDVWHVSGTTIDTSDVLGHIKRKKEFQSHHFESEQIVKQIVNLKPILLHDYEYEFKKYYKK